MPKKKKKSRAPSQKVFGQNERALRELQHMKHRDLQRACIVRGLSPKDVVDFDHHKLVQWFIQNFENAQNENLLLEYDLWVEEQLKEKGYKVGDNLMSPALRFSYTGNIESMAKPQIIKPANTLVPVAPVKEKKEKSSTNEVTGIRAGTMKDMTYNLTKDKKTIIEIIKLVTTKFPNAKEKSIKIWYKRALKL